MNAIKSWSLIICFVSIICTIFETLIPSGKMEKIFKLILSAFMLCSILIPLKATLSRISFDAKKDQNIIENQSKLKSTIENQTKISMQQNMKMMVEKILKTKNIKTEKINIIMDTKPDNCISIKKIQVFLARGDEDKKNIVQKILEKKLELNIEVLIGSE